VTSTALRTCDQCGEDEPEVEFDQGYCMHCAQARQQALDFLNAQVDWWNKLNDAERDEQIRRAARGF
jgi:hypothetical protein